MEKGLDKDRDGDRVLLLPDDFPDRNSLQFYGLALLGRRWPRSMTITFLFILLPIRFIVREDCRFRFDRSYDLKIAKRHLNPTVVLLIFHSFAY